MPLPTGATAILYTNRPLFMSPTDWLEGTLIPSASRPGWYNIALPGGLVLSIQPKSVHHNPYQYATRPAGTDGGYEQFALTAKGNLYVKPDVGTIIGCEYLG